MSQPELTKQDEEFLVACIAHYQAFIDVLERDNIGDQRKTRLIFRQQKFHAEKFLERIRENGVKP